MNTATKALPFSLMGFANALWTSVLTAMRDTFTSIMVFIAIMLALALGQMLGPAITLFTAVIGLVAGALSQRGSTWLANHFEGEKKLGRKVGFYAAIAVAVLALSSPVPVFVKVMSVIIAFMVVTTTLTLTGSTNKSTDDQAASRHQDMVIIASMIGIMTISLLILV